MQSSYFSFVFHVIFVLSVFLSSNINMAFAMEEDDSKAIVISQGKLNVRSGPDTTFGLVTQLNPSEEVTVIGTDNISEGWVKIRSSSGFVGYVSSKYLEGDFSNVSRNAELESDDFYRDVFVLPFSIKYSHIFSYFYSMGFQRFLVIISFVFLIQILLILWLRNYYSGLHSSRSPVWAYMFMFVGAFLTLPGLFMYKYAIYNGETAIIVYLLMLLSTGCLMLHSAWQIKLCGMYNGIRKVEGSPHYQVGRWIGNILWLLLLLPFAKIWWHICDKMDVINVGDGFGVMLLTMLIIGLINFLIVRFVWPHFFVRFLFQTANQGIVHTMSFILCYGILSYEYDIIYHNFDFITFFFALCIYLIIISVTIAFAWSTITVYRCANCHSFNTAEVGFTDLGTVYRTDSNWENIDGSAVRQRISGSVVTDARRLVCTTKEVSRWRTHHKCYHCSRNWNIDHEMTVGKTSQTVKKEWTEHY